MNEYYEVPKNSPYYGFDALLAQKKNTFYDFFRKNLPSLKTIKNANTGVNGIFHQYFLLRNEAKIVERYPYETFYRFQGNILNSSNYTTEREQIFRDIISCIFTFSPNISSHYDIATQAYHFPPDFSLRLNENHIAVSDTNIYITNTLEHTMYTMLIIMTIKYFKAFPSALAQLLNIYKERFSELGAEQRKKQIEKKEQEQKRETNRKLREALARQQQREWEQQELEKYEKACYETLKEKIDLEGKDMLTEDERRFIEDYEYFHNPNE